MLRTLLTRGDTGRSSRLRHELRRRRREQRGHRLVVRRRRPGRATRPTPTAGSTSGIRSWTCAQRARPPSVVSTARGDQAVRVLALRVVLRLPVLPQPGQRERAAVARSACSRAACGPRPRCHSYQPSAGIRQRRAFSARRNAGFSRGRLRPGVDHPGAALRVLRPRRHQPPAHHAAGVRSTVSGSGVPSSSRGCRSTTATICLVGATL